MLWRLFFVMHCAESEHLEKLCSALQPADCKQRLKDPEHLENFEKYLKSMNCSEEICLLTTFAQMAQTKRADVSYVSLSTRETFSKVGRELLGAIASIHTQIISVLLDRVRETIEKVGMDALHLDPAVHSEVALMVLEAYQKYLSQKPYAGLLSESIKQVSYLASIVRYGETPETSFNQWAWGLILRLKLHRNDRGMQQGWPAVPVSGRVLDMTESVTLHPLLKAVKANIPVGCYLALAMTTLGHSIERFCAEGIPLLGVLIQSRYLRTVVHVLDKILPLFYSCQYYLLKNEQFLSYLQLFLHLDSGVPQGVTQQVWFSWMVLNMESIFEEDSQLRRVVEGELVINALTPDQALKKAQAQLKLPIVPSLQRLMIYRWAHQALATPADHPLMPLIWQKFFLLYLHRPGPQYGLPVDGCIGRRFFQSAAQVNLLSEMKQRLIEVADFHHAASKALRVESPAEGSDRSPEKASGSSAYLTSPELHKELVRLCNVFVLWLEEESFQKGDTYIPSLPKQYDAHRLAKVMQNQQDLWMEYVNVELIHHEFQEALNLWLQVQLESHTTCASAGQTDFTNPLSAKERIMNNLKKFDTPKPLLPLQTMKAPVPVISSASLVSQKEAIQLMRMDLNILQRHAKTAALWESQHVALNSEILDTVPKLYVNREEQITLHLECRGTSNKGCQGAALLTIQFDLIQWLSAAKPPLSERTKLLESIHLALNACGLEPEEDILMPFNIFCKHWTNLLQYQFPDHYSDFLRLFVQRVGNMFDICMFVR
ncbi:hypothetical protein llap_16241 [Limosa lapponica baueri]|uniref:Uncharacterized protein n=1 Tax=Limosa lapponica baueri TaxID=1758121 RepID=A0A2I0TI54_LIMLA|nr:hypothetical protein llap_16241 [Limosa lapponica baueri]